MTTFCCGLELIRIMKLSDSSKAGAIQELPEDCGNAQCTTRNCRKEVGDRLRQMWIISRRKR